MSFLLAYFALMILPASPVSAEEIQIVQSGKYYGTVDAYRIGSTYYMSAKDAAQLYGGRVYWYPVSGRVQISIRGKQTAFRVDSHEVQLPGKTIRLSHAVIVRSVVAFIPMEFFVSEDFSDVVGFDSKFNSKTRLLLVDRRSSVGPLRWFSYPDYTRIVLELQKDLKYKTDTRGLKGIDVTIAQGIIDWAEQVDIQDGAVEYVHLSQEGSQARLSVKLQPDAGDWKLKEFGSPRRLVLDVFREASPKINNPQVQVPMDIPAAPAPNMKYRVAIDPGHGGRDSGAAGRRGSLEKDINLSVARELSELLKEEGLFEVLLIRDSDNFVPLAERSRIANQFEANLFVSLHCNAHPSKSESGFEIYFLSERASDPDAERLAEFENSVLTLEGKEAEEAATSVLYALAKTEFINDASELSGLMAKTLARRVNLPNRGVKQAAFYVLRGANAPAVLVEMGFLSNLQDEAKLQSKKYRRRIVEGLYAGILEFMKRKGSQ